MTRAALSLIACYGVGIFLKHCAVPTLEAVVSAVIIFILLLTVD